MADIDSITFHEEGWRPTRDEPRLREWRHAGGDRRVYDFLPDPGPLPFNPRDAGAARAFHRERAAASGGAIVEVDVLSRRDLLIHRVVTKFPERPRGMIFVSGVSFRLGGAAFDIRHECPGGALADARETAVARELGVNPAPPGILARLLGRTDAWFRDPYDADYRGPLLRCRADDEEWDARFPDSPLSRARRHLMDLLDSLEVSG